MNDNALGDLYDASILDVARRRLEKEERLLGDSVPHLSSMSLVVPKDRESDVASEVGSKRRNAEG